MTCYLSPSLFGHEKIIDNFAGGGGASKGIEQGIGRSVDLAINHDKTALSIHALNHPGCDHAVADVWDIDPETAAQGMPVGLAWFSPDCRHHSHAKGGKPVSKSVRGLAWVSARWAAKVKPRVIIVENVKEFLDWGPLVKGPDGKIRPCPKRKGQTFRGYVRCLKRHGYDVDWKLLRASEFGTPTIRERLFLIARRDKRPIVWPKATHGDPKSPAVQRGLLKPFRTAAECIDWTIPCNSIFGRKKPLAANTLKRIGKGVERLVIKHPQPFIVKLNHTAAYYDAFRGQSIDLPLQTITTSPGFALVKPTFVAEEMLSAADKEKALVTAAFLAPYYGSGSGLTGRDLRDPLPTITTKDRFQLITVTIDSKRMVIVDIGMRMLQPHELAKAQGFPADYDFSKVGGKRLAKNHQTRLIGNSVCPPLARAIVAANFTHEQSYMPLLEAA